MNKRIEIITGTSRENVQERANDFMSKHNVVDVKIQTCYFDGIETAHFTVMIIYEV